MPIPESNEIQMIKYEETIHQQRIPSGQGLIGATPYWVQIGTPLEGVVGINNVNGTEILEINIPAGHVFVCSNFWYSCNEGRSVAVCTVDDAQVLGHGSQTQVAPFGSDNKGLHALLKEQDPIFVVDNSLSDVDIDMLVFAPHIVFGVTPNDAATSYFEAFIAGLLYRGNIVQRGTV
nr:MAG: hypothetical protein [uncultured archaeon]